MLCFALITVFGLTLRPAGAAARVTTVAVPLKQR